MVSWSAKVRTIKRFNKLKLTVVMTMTNIVGCNKNLHGIHEYITYRKTYSELHEQHTHGLMRTITVVETLLGL